MASVVSVDDLNAAKDKGNYHFLQKSYKDAVVAYGKGLRRLEEHKVEELTGAHLEVQAKLAANQAQCFINLEDWEGCIEACNKSLKAVPLNKKALFRRSIAYEKLEQPSDAMEDIIALLKIDPKVEPVIEASRRVSVQLKKDSEIKQSFHSFVKQLVLNPSCDKEKNIGHVIARMASSPTYLKPVCTSGFLEKLQSAVLDLRESGESRIICFKGLRQAFRLLEKAPTLKVKYYENFVHNTIGLMRYGNGMQNTKLGQELDYQASLFLASVAADDNFQRLDGAYLHVVADAFAEFFVGSSLSKKGGQGSLEYTDAQRYRLDHSLKAIGYASMLNNKALEVMRVKCLPHLLLSDLTDDVELQSSLVGCLVALASKGGEEKKEDDKKKGKQKKGGKSKKKGKKGAAAEPAAKTAAATSTSNFSGICSSWIARFLMTENSLSIAKGLKALSLVLRASPDTGFQILTDEKTLQKVVDLSAGDVEEVDSSLRLTAAEVLALGSTDSQIRRSITESGNFAMFIDLLDSKDVSVKAHAGLALSKYAAGEESVRKRVLEDSSVLTAMMEILSTLKSATASPEEKSDEGVANGDTASSEWLSNAPALVQSTASTAVETIAYLSIHIETKQQLASRNNGEWTKLLLSLADCSNRAIRHGVVQLVLNMTMSTEDRKRLFNDEVEQLKRIAQKGLKKHSKEREFMEERAGSAAQIEAVREKLISCGAVKAITDLFALHQKAIKDQEHILERKKRAAGDYNPMKKATPLEGLQEAVSSIICNLVSVSKDTPTARGFMVQQGALRTLLDLNKSSSEKAKASTTVAIARLLISVNPNLLRDSVVPGAINALVAGLKEVNHELYEFEMMMALTNLASVEPLRDRLMESGAWAAAMNVLASDNFQCQRSAVEFFANVVLCEKAFERLVKGSDQDIKLIIMFAKTDDLPTAKAATAFLANICTNEDLAKKVKEQGGLDALKVLKGASKDEEVLARVDAALERMKANGVE